MIRNLPETIDALRLKEFDFGSIEASTDVPLEHCFCKTVPIEEFLTDRYNILLGAKGAGKSSVFSLIGTGKLSFKGIEERRHHILSLDEELEYQALRALIDHGLTSLIVDPPTRAFFLWESYLLFRLCAEFREQPNVEPELRKVLAEFCDGLLGTPDKTTLFKILSRFKPTITFKIDASNPAMLTPAFSISAPEGEKANDNEEKKPEIKIIDLQRIKRTINQIAGQLKSTIYILVDHLDDFVAKEDYRTQKTMLEGLVRTCKGYDAYENIKLKVFLRTDLYEKLDFSQMGGREKIDQRCVELAWSEQDIRQFIAERLQYNLRSVYGITNLVAVIDKSSFYIRHQCASPPHGDLLHKLSRLLQNKVEANDLYDERYIHLRDGIYRMIIECFFPSRISHFTVSGEMNDLDLFQYLQSHFQLANSECTPRHMLLFLQHLRKVAYAYYAANPDQAKVRLTDGRFHLFHRRHIIDAYFAVQSRMCEVFKAYITYHPWQKKIDIFFQKKGHETSFSAAQLMKMLQIPSDELKDVLACFEHLRIMKCRNKTVPVRERIYDIPILLQFVYDPKKRTVGQEQGDTGQSTIYG